MTKFMVPIEEPGGVRRFCHDWFLTSGPLWKGVSLSFERRACKINIVVNINDNPNAEEVIRDGFFGRRGFLTSKGWRAFEVAENSL